MNGEKACLIPWLKSCHPANTQPWPRPPCTNIKTGGLLLGVEPEKQAIYTYLQLELSCCYCLLSSGASWPVFKGDKFCVWSNTAKAVQVTWWQCDCPCFLLWITLALTSLCDQKRLGSCSIGFPKLFTKSNKSPLVARTLGVWLEWKLRVVKNREEKT